MRSITFFHRLTLAGCLAAPLLLVGCGNPDSPLGEARQAQEDLEEAREEAAEMVSDAESDAVETIADAKEAAERQIQNAKEDAGEMVEQAKQKLDTKLQQLQTLPVEQRPQSDASQNPTPPANAEIE
ncbi:hypothetical protein [Rhodopirellula sp. MGV]|uniref:hypothetical protein n=1 Tax=Rhodopirellula sp. MGV TaxID=2023130 RepID=UPI000B962CBC|nr:hypothetical protein [Rhodopirellula sp. MGV]OYP33106.1 hypothetical protein CGZ80_17925 [Rhodopirellula sp. MGV]PNY35163.1 hypothetical protein C2E31_19890 [Rhodopirellula baltica]